MRHPKNSPLPSFNPLEPFVTEDVRPLLSGTTTPPSPPGLTTAAKRKKYFEKESRRKAVTYGPDVSGALSSPSQLAIVMTPNIGHSPHGLLLRLLPIPRTRASDPWRNHV